MFELSQELQEELLKCNEKLRKLYNNEKNLSREKFRALLKSIGRFFYMDKYDESRIPDCVRDRALVGVDGSIVTTGGLYPHYVALLQAMAKSTQHEAAITKAQVYTPLIEQEKEANKQLAIENQMSIGSIDQRKRNALLASLEVKAALDSVNVFTPGLIIMDGSLVHFKIDQQLVDGVDIWEKLVSNALAKNVFLVGVAEEIKTQEIALALEEKLPETMRLMYDKEILFGVLNYGEAFEIYSTKNKRGFRTCFLRLADSPSIVGLDMLEEQKHNLEDICNIIFTLTPRDGRGIPIWLDIVDKEVRITNNMLDNLIDRYIDPELRLRLLTLKRSERIL